MMRYEVTVGGILGLVLGGLVTFGLAHEPVSVSPGPDLAPLQWTDSAALDDGDATDSDGEHRPVRPGSQRVFDTPATRS